MIGFSDLTFLLQEHSKWLKRSAAVLNLFFDVIFSMCYVPVIDYFVFTANCEWAQSPIVHTYFPDKRECCSVALLRKGLISY